MLSPDQQRLVRVWDYCQHFEQILDRFGPTWEAFSTDRDYQSVAAFDLLQIGELVANLSPEFRAETTEQINWAEIKGLRNIVVHNYGGVKLDIVWAIINRDIPILKEFCERHLPEEF